MIGGASGNDQSEPAMPSRRRIIDALLPTAESLGGEQEDKKFPRMKIRKTVSGSENNKREHPRGSGGE